MCTTINNHRSIDVIVIDSKDKQPKSSSKTHIQKLLSSPRHVTAIIIVCYDLHNKNHSQVEIGLVQEGHPSVKHSLHAIQYVNERQIRKPCKPEI